jgi:hypothetical protein
MSNIMKPPPEYSTPPVPDYARFPNYSRYGQPPRKSHSGVWIVLSIIALVSIIGCTLLAWGVSFAIRTFGGPAIATDQYYSAIKGQDYARAYTYLGPQLKTVFSQEAFTQMAQQHDAVDGKVTGFSFSGLPTGDQATVGVTVTRMNGTSYTVHLELRQEGGAWVISAFDRI